MFHILIDMCLFIHRLDSFIYLFYVFIHITYIHLIDRNLFFTFLIAQFFIFLLIQLFSYLLIHLFIS